MRSRESCFLFLRQLWFLVSDWKYFLSSTWSQFRFFSVFVFVWFFMLDLNASPSSSWDHGCRFDCGHFAHHCDARLVLLQMTSSGFITNSVIILICITDWLLWLIIWDIVKETAANPHTLSLSCVVPVQVSWVKPGMWSCLRASWESAARASQSRVALRSPAIRKETFLTAATVGCGDEEVCLVPSS